LNARTPAFYGLVAIAIANIAAHALLVREMLMLGSMLLALYFWEAGLLDERATAPPTGAWRRAGVTGLCVALLLAAVDAVASFSRFPFERGQRCLEARQWGDGWTSGRLQQRLPVEARGVALLLSWPRRDLANRPLDIEVSLRGDNGDILAMRRLHADRPDLRLVPVAFDVPSGLSAGTVVVEASHCYVARNLGHTDDSRPLGVRVLSVRATDEAGRTLPLP
jgi:hypothetical protein